jgi:hypothetical protein
MIHSPGLILRKQIAAKRSIAIKMCVSAKLAPSLDSKKLFER